MIRLASQETCTGCAACANICPKSAIEMQMDKEGFLFPFIDEDLCVIQNREDSADMAAVYRKNISRLMERMEAFRENGYSNEGLMEYYIRKEQKEINFFADFTTVRIALGMEQIPLLEKEEIMEKLDEMEEICAQVVPRSKKWESLREYLIWLSGKDVNIAMQILPLFFRINDTITKRQGS